MVPNINTKNALDLVRDSKMWMLVFSFSLAPLSKTVIGQFFIYYSEKSHLFTQVNTGIALSIYFITGIAGGVIYGKFYDRTVHKATIQLLTTISFSLLFIKLSFIISSYLLLTVFWSVGFLTSAILLMLYYNIIDVKKRQN